MKTLVLMRHAKAETHTLGKSDFERTLTERGDNDAKTMGLRLFKKQLTPDLIVCSAAKRTQKTAHYLAETLKISTKKIVAEFDLYEANIADLLTVIRNLPNETNTIVIVGHNPTFTSIVGYLTHTQIEHLPTAGQSCITFNFNNWLQILPQSGKLEWIDFPKNN